MKKDALKRLRELKNENVRLKRAVADLNLDKAILNPDPGLFLSRTGIFSSLTECAESSSE